MSPDNKVIMIDSETIPSRSDLMSSHKEVTGDFFKGFSPNFGGYIITSKAKLAVQWMFDPKDMDAVIEYLKTNTLRGFEPEIYKNGLLVKIY